MLYLRARYYDLALGTFLTKDPVVGQVGGMSIRWNAYAYAGNNPVNYVDPDGRFFWMLPVIAAGAAWLVGYLAQEYADVALEPCHPLRAVLDVAGELLGWNAVRYSLNVLRDPSAPPLAKGRELVSAVFHAALGINFVQSIGTFAVNVARLGVKGVTTGLKGIRELVSPEGLQRLISQIYGKAPRVFDSILKGGFKGFYDDATKTIFMNARQLGSGILGAFNRIGTALHEATHFIQWSRAGTIGKWFLNQSIWVTSEATTIAGKAARAISFVPLYVWNPAELQAIAQGGNILAAFGADYLVPNFLPLIQRGSEALRSIIDS